MRMFLEREKCWNAIATQLKADAKADEIAAFEEMDRKCMQTIVLSIENTELVHIHGIDGGLNVWKALKAAHMQSSLSAKIRVMKKMFRLRLLRGESMVEHLQKLFGYVNELADLGQGLDKGMSVSVVLASLNEEYDSIITALEAWDESRLTLEAVRAKLIEEYEKKKSDGRRSEEERALPVMNRAQRPRVDEGYDAVGAGGRGEPWYANKICFACGQIGHLARKCNMNTRKFVNKELNKVNESAKLARFDQWYTKCFVGNENKRVAGAWYIDSGASSHMCSDRILFQNLSLNGEFGAITIANGTSMSILGKGDVNLKVGSDESLVAQLSDVLFSPELDNNLISVKKLTEKGLAVFFENENCYLLRPGDNKRILIGRFDGSLYRLLLNEQCYSVNKRLKCLHEWHRCLAHRNLGDIKLMIKEGLRVRSCTCADVCESCIKGKMSRKPFPKTSTPVTNVMDCVVSDVSGPMHIESLGRKRYFVSFTDVFSRHSTIFLMRNKSEVYEKLVQYVERMKTQLKMVPKVIRSDRAAEYLSEKVKHYLEGEGIQQQCTVGFAPEQNGVSERLNRTLMEAARSMLCESGLPKSLWGEAVNTAAYVLNRLPLNGNGKSPQEILFNDARPLDAHEFGSDVYVMIPYEKRRKLDDKAEKCKFVGYDEMSKGFRILTKSRSIKVAREVVFLDTKENWNEITENSECGSVIVDFYENNSISTELPENDENDLEQSQDDVFEEAEDARDEIEERSNSDSSSENIENPSLMESDSSELLGFDENLVPVSSSRNHSVASGTALDDNDAVVGDSRPVRSTRGQPPSRYNPADGKSYAVHGKCLAKEPRSYKEAVNSHERNEWIAAMEAELNSIETNKTWELTNLPRNRKSIGSKWVFKRKLDDQGRVVRYKARLVAQGFTQKYGIDYDEVFAPVARSTTMRLLLSIAGMKEFYVNQYDIKTAFLNGELQEEIYLRQPIGFREGDKVYRLKKSLYGLKQAARVWNQTLHNVLVQNGCVQSLVDKCLYIRKQDDKILYLSIHVDDLLSVSNCEKYEKDFMNIVSSKFELTNLGNVKHYLGIDIEKDREGNFLISQEKYIDKIIEEANLESGKESKFPLDTGYFRNYDEELLDTNDQYRKLIGMLLYLSTNSRPDVAASVSILSQKIASPSKTDLNEVKRVIRYLKGTKTMKLALSDKERGGGLMAYSDANWAEDRHDRKSNTGYFCTINGGALAWCCRKQDLVTMSSTEAEYVALSETCKEMLWIRRLCRELGVEDCLKLRIFVDNQSCMKITENDKFSNRTKHIDTKYHFIKDLAATGDLKLSYVNTIENIADMLTKPLGGNKIAQHRSAAGLK